MTLMLKNRNKKIQNGRYFYNLNKNENSESEKKHSYTRNLEYQHITFKLKYDLENAQHAQTNLKCYFVP